jgi:hypothetical protein
VTLRIDQNTLTLRELGEVNALLGRPLSIVMQSPEQHLGIAAIACVIMRRENPAATLDDMLDLPLSELEMVEGKASTAPNGVSPSDLPVSGV